MIGGFTLSAFQTLYLASDVKNTFEQIKEKVIEVTPKISPDIAKGRPQVYENTDAVLKIWCEYFSLSLKIGGQSVKNKSEDYGINFEYQLWFDIYTESPNWLEEVLCFVGKIMKTFDGDCVLESNGEQPLIVRKNMTVAVDDNKLNGLQRLPFDELGIEYQNENLKSI